ncbi:MAG: DUF2252 family protein, partial [Pseudonocardia sediminis]
MTTTTRTTTRTTTPPAPVGTGTTPPQDVRTREDRVARGREARRAVPRESHADLPSPPDRPDPVALLEGQGVARVPELLPIRYGRMAVSPFTFLRGAALPMAADLAGTPRTGIDVQICGDAHIANFGFFASPERNLVFDVNDFDETLPGPWEWDVKRLATSLEVACRGNGFPAKRTRRIVVGAVAAYRSAMRSFAGMTSLQVWYARADMAAVQKRIAPTLDKRRRRTLTRAVDKARTRDNLGALGRFAGTVDGRPRIVAAPPLIVPVGDLFG